MEDYSQGQMDRIPPSFDFVGTSKQHTIEGKIKWDLLDHSGIWLYNLLTVQVHNKCLYLQHAKKQMTFESNREQKSWFEIAFPQLHVILLAPILVWWGFGAVSKFRSVESISVCIPVGKQCWHTLVWGLYNVVISVI